MQVNGPLHGYQYPAIRSAGTSDPNSIFLSGNLNCPSFDESVAEGTATSEFSTTEEEFRAIYDVVGSAALEGVLSYEFWDYNNAYAIYDYLRYQDKYNATVHDALLRYKNVESNRSCLDTLRWLADEQQFSRLGNLTAHNSLSRKNKLRNADLSISAIAGNTFANSVLGSMLNSIRHQASGYSKLSLFFADYQPLTSFFALAGLPDLDADFYGTPNFASSAVFELFSYSNTTADTAFPDEEDLWVRFYFRNVTDPDEDFRSYPLFGRGSASTDLPWAVFETEMRKIWVEEVGDWCMLCNATSIFCAAYTPELKQSAAQQWLEGHGISLWPGHGRGLAPTVAGVVGALVALVAASLLAGVVMLLGGIRLERKNPSTMGDSRGFKGGQEMRSDQDVAFPKGGLALGAILDRNRAAVGAFLERNTSPDITLLGSGGRVRVGSWELKLQQDPFTDPISTIDSTLPQEEV